MLILPRFRFNVDAVRKFHQIFPRFKRPQIKDVCEKPVKWKINEEKLWQTLCLGNKVIYFLPSFCRLQLVESEVSEDLPPKDGAPYTPFRQFVAPNGDGFPPTTSHGLTGSPCWKSNYHREAWGALWTLFCRMPAAPPAATRLRIRNVLIMGTVAQQQSPHKSHTQMRRNPKTKDRKLNKNNAKYIG